MSIITAIKHFLLPVVERYRLVRFRSLWKKKNGHNQTMPNNVFPIDKVKVGNYTYGELNVKTYGNPDSKLLIGHFCSIAGEVVFILDGEHNYKRFSTYPFPSKVFHICNDSGCKGSIIIEDDVWIGYRATILSGSHLGQGCVIGAGSVVSGSVPPYSIFANGRVIKMRFDNSIVEQLLDLDFSKIDNNTLETIKEYCNSEIGEYDIRVLKSLIS